MLDFADLPYRYFPPKRNALIAWLLSWHNRLRYLPKVVNVAAVEVSGQESLHAARRPGDRVLVLPNHPTHADAAIFVEAMRRARLTPQFMAAYDVFLRSKFDAFVMQRIGSFSVDREGSDTKSMKQAMASLNEGRYALTIFPEGNVYLQNDRVTPFHEGAAFLAVRVAKELGDSRRILAVPVSIKATFIEDVRPTLARMIHESAAAVDCELDDTMTPLDALRRIGVVMMRRNLKQRGITFDKTDDLPALIERAAECVLEQLEAKLDLSPKPNESLMDRVRSARRVVHEVRCDEQRIADHAAAATWADEAMLALRILSYSGRYVAESPTVDRIGETVEKLTEDLHRRMLPPLGRRRVLVRFNEPIVVNDYLAEGQKTRAAIRALTSDCEAAVQDGLDELNANNAAAGSAVWQDPVEDLK